MFVLCLGDYVLYPSRCLALVFAQWDEHMVALVAWTLKRPVLALYLTDMCQPWGPYHTLLSCSLDVASTLYRHGLFVSIMATTWHACHLGEHDVLVRCCPALLVVHMYVRRIRG